MTSPTDVSETCRQVATPPPFTCSTTRNSLAWLADGGPVDFTRETNEQVTSASWTNARVVPALTGVGVTHTTSIHDVDGISNTLVSSQTSERRPRKLRKQPPSRRTEMKDMAYPENLRTAERRFQPSSDADHPLDTRNCTPEAATVHPILANPIMTKSNPRGPRKRYWGALFRKHWWWFVPLNIVFTVAFTMYFVYQEKIADETDTIRKWLAERALWSWSVPTAILILLSLPALLLHPATFRDLAIPGWAIGIASLSTLLGDAALFLIFKYAASDWVWRKCEERTNWAAIARVSEESGLRGVLMIRFSIVPPSLANPIFATTGMSLWLYVSTIVISLPKQIVLVILGYPSTKDDKGAIAAKIVAISGFIVVTIWGTFWLRRQLRIAKDAIRAERNEELSGEIRKQVRLVLQKL